MDFAEITKNSKPSGKKGKDLMVFNDRGTLFLSMDKEVKVLKLKYYKNYKTVSTNRLLEIFLHIPFDSLSPSNEKKIPELHIIKKDVFRNSLEIIPAHLIFSLGDDNMYKDYY